LECGGRAKRAVKPAHSKCGKGAKEAIMITTIRLWLSTIRTTLTNIPALLIFAVLYALLLVSAYFFISTHEATMWQVFVTYALIIVVPAEFFLFNASIVDRTRNQKFHWGTIVVDALKFFIVTIPVLLIAWGLYYLLNKLGARFPAPVVISPPAFPGLPRAVHWPTLIFATLRFVLLGIAVPLALIHLWIAVSGSGLRSWMVKRIGSVLARAFAFESVLIYALGLIVFFALPYAVLFVPFSPVATSRGSRPGVSLQKSALAARRARYSWQSCNSCCKDCQSPGPARRKPHFSQWPGPVR
jgi:hypothetical protein